MVAADTTSYHRAKHAPSSCKIKQSRKVISFSSLTNIKHYLLLVVSVMLENSPTFSPPVEGNYSGKKILCITKLGQQDCAQPTGKCVYQFQITGTQPDFASLTVSASLFFAKD